MHQADLDLTTRTGLPDTLRTLFATHPREGWAQHPEFGPLTQFWLERHLGFRQILGTLTADLAEFQAGRLDPEAYAPRLSRLGGIFMQELHMHHSIEDDVYFPKLAVLAPKLERGFALLDADHHRLHDALDGFAAAANAALCDEGVGSLGESLEQMTAFLDRHLTDEEELVVPVILSVGEGRL